MARSGRCRCGTLLRFEKTARGYKTRCPSCQAVVRLRDTREPALATTTDYAVAPPELGVLEVEADAPLASPAVPVYNAREPVVASGCPWWLLAVAVLAVVLTGATVTVLLTL